MDELTAFKLFLIQERLPNRRQRSPKTVALHLQLLSRVRDAVPDLSPPGIMQHLLSLHEQGRKGSYLNDYIDTLHVYGRFKQTPLYETLRYFPEEEFVKATMSKEEIEQFLALPAKRKGVKQLEQHNRWTLFFKILAYSGMRCGEVAHLTVDAVDFGRQVYILTETKTHTSRYVPIAQHLIPELQAYIKTLTGTYLFPSRNGGTGRQGGVFSDVQWGYHFHDRIKQLGIKRKNLSPYSLRHSFITRMLDEDVSLPKVQKIVGHRRIDTTMHYTHLTTKDITKAIEKDPLSRQELPFEHRFKLFRESVRNLLTSYAKTVHEEKQMLMALIDNS